MKGSTDMRSYCVYLPAVNPLFFLETPSVGPEPGWRAPTITLIPEDDAELKLRILDAVSTGRQLRAWVEALDSKVPDDAVAEMLALAAALKYGLPPHQSPGNHPHNDVYTRCALALLVSKVFYGQIPTAPAGGTFNGLFSNDSGIELRVPCASASGESGGNNDAAQQPRRRRDAAR